MDRLADADAAIMAARDFFACAPGWRDVWKTEIGPIIEDLDVLDDVADTLESVNAALASWRRLRHSGSAWGTTRTR